MSFVNCAELDGDATAIRSGLAKASSCLRVVGFGISGVGDGESAITWSRGEATGSPSLPGVFSLPGSPPSSSFLSFRRDGSTVKIYSDTVSDYTQQSHEAYTP